MSHLPVATTDEIISTINRSSLPTVIIEGDDDVIIYRRLESVYASQGLSVLPVGGRDRVIEIFKRRSEITSAGVVCFVADKDAWVIIGVPAEFNVKEFIVTNGYSIENDALMDIKAEEFMTGAERCAFQAELERFCRWYALAFQRYIGGQPALISMHPNHVLGDVASYDSLINLSESEEYPDAMFDRLLNNYSTELRGKSLLRLLMRQLGASGRNPKHNHKAILEYAASAGGELIGRIYRDVGDAFGYTT